MFKHGPGTTFCSLLLLVAPLAASTTAKHVKKHAPAKHEQPHESPATVPTTPQPPVPLEQLTLQQMPAIPAQVLYTNRELTITARNSTMSDILRQVKRLTGATMDFPPNATERVVGQFGPGPARDVLASLLDGTNFNYVMLGSVANPTGVDRVIVTVKPSGPENINPAAQNNAQDASEQEGLGATDSDQDQTTDNPPPDDQGQQPSSDEDQNSSPRAIRTPEQLLQELQRQQQLQQQHPNTQPQTFSPAPAQTAPTK